jgi:hypothetical protein
MFKSLKNHRGQATVMEYVMMFFLVSALMAAMSLYVKRAVQARMRDARRYMVLQVNAVYTGNIALGNLTLGYEPYYLDSVTYRSQDTDDTLSLIGSTLPTASSGIFQAEYDEVTRSRVFSNTAPPRNAD